MLGPKPRPNLIWFGRNHTCLASPTLRLVVLGWIPMRYDEKPYISRSPVRACQAPFQPKDPLIGSTFFVVVNERDASIWLLNAESGGATSPK